jgi:Pvc16 N-terminal domain
MSNGLAIAAVTETLRKVLETGLAADLPNADSFTAKPPDLARGNNTGDQINLFLYHVTPNAAWRNMDPPKQTRPGEYAPPALPLVLDYLITAYGDKDHRLIGKAMSILYDYPLLNPADIQAALGEAGLHQQVERVRLTMQPLSLEDMYRLWNGFQTQYRISAAYQVSVVLIESARSSRASLPVIKRGSDDSGVKAVAGANPALSELVLPNVQSSVRLGETIVIRGTNVSVDDAMVRFFHPSFTVPLEVAPAAGDNAGEIAVTLPKTAAAMSAWAPGLFTVSLVLRRPTLPAWTTNELPLAVGPLITRTPKTVAGGGTLTVASTPRIRDGQRVLLILGDRQIAPKTITNDADLTKPTSIDFVVPAMPAGSYVIRLRVDGIDSIPVIQQGAPPKPAFDPDQMVTF